MISCTGGNNSSFLFLFSEGSKSIAGSSDFEASNILKIFSFKVDLGVVFFGEILGFGQGCMFHDSFAFSVGLVDGIGWDKFGAPI